MCIALVCRPHQHFIPSCLSCNSRTSVSWMVLSYSLRALPMVGHHGIHEIFILFTSLRNTLPETNSLHLKMDGWKMKCLFGMVYFQLRTVSFRMFPHVSNKKGASSKGNDHLPSMFFFSGRPSYHSGSLRSFCRKKLATYCLRNPQQDQLNGPLTLSI